MKNTNWLANIFDWFGDALERFNPSAFRFLAAALPYITPVPVAWLTSRSSAQFLGFTPRISFLLVFALEGIGLWFTTMLVDAVVDFIRSKNWKALLLALILGITVAIYVSILVDLNVTLEAASGNVNPAMSRVITLLCLLPLITGTGNGYYKLKLDHKTQTQIARQHQEELDAKLREERREERLERLRIKSGNFPAQEESSKKVSSGNGKFQNLSGKSSDWRKVRPQLSTEQLERIANLSPDIVKQYSSETGFTYKTISNWRANARNELGIRS